MHCNAECGKLYNGCCYIPSILENLTKYLCTCVSCIMQVMYVCECVNVCGCMCFMLLLGGFIYCSFTSALSFRATILKMKQIIICTHTRARSVLDSFIILMLPEVFICLFLRYSHLSTLIFCFLFLFVMLL